MRYKNHAKVGGGRVAFYIKTFFLILNKKSGYCGGKKGTLTPRIARIVFTDIDDCIAQYCFAKSKGSICIKCIWKLAFKDTYVKEN